MTTTFITITSAPAGSEAVVARFLREGDEILANGTILRVRETLDAARFGGSYYVVCRDLADREVTVVTASDAMIPLYDRTTADAVLVAELRKMATA